MFQQELNAVDAASLGRIQQGRSIVVIAQVDVGTSAQQQTDCAAIGSVARQHQQRTLARVLQVDVGASSLYVRKNIHNGSCADGCDLYASYAMFVVHKIAI